MVLLVRIRLNNRGFNLSTDLCGVSSAYSILERCMLEYFALGTKIKRTSKQRKGSDLHIAFQDDWTCLGFEHNVARKRYVRSNKHPILDLPILPLGYEQFQVSRQTGHVLADHIMRMFERVEHIACLTPIRSKPRGRLHQVISTDR